LHEIQNGQAELDCHLCVFTVAAENFRVVKRFQQPNAFLERLGREDRDFRSSSDTPPWQEEKDIYCLNLKKYLRSMWLREYFPMTAFISIIVGKIFKAIH